jgi:hypothetical protein
MVALKGKWIILSLLVFNPIDKAWPLSSPFYSHPLLSLPLPSNQIWNKTFLSFIFYFLVLFHSHCLKEMIYRLAQSPKMETKKRQDRFFIYFIYIYIYIRKSISLEITKRCNPCTHGIYRIEPLKGRKITKMDF